MLQFFKNQSGKLIFLGLLAASLFLKIEVFIFLVLFTFYYKGYLSPFNKAVQAPAESVSWSTYWDQQPEIDQLDPFVQMANNKQYSPGILKRMMNLKPFRQS